MNTEEAFRFIEIYKQWHLGSENESFVVEEKVLEELHKTMIVALSKVRNLIASSGV